MNSSTHDNVLPRTISGVAPDLCLAAEPGPPRSECGVVAFMAWGGRLWTVSYVSHKAASGVGTGLYWIDDQFRLHKHPESRVGTYTNRMIHTESNQLVIGPHIISVEGEVRTIDALVDIRICATFRHLFEPETKVYMLGMEGELFELNVHTLETAQIQDLTRELGVPSHEYAHFKAGYTAFGKVFVANNSYDERDFSGTEAAGRLAEWDGEKWSIIERTSFMEVTGRGDFTDAVFAVGMDKSSAILRVYTARDQTWTRYRLPKASHTYDHMWQTEWPRIREVDHERFLVDCHGMFYELSPWTYAGRVWGIRPISTHLWVMGDFCTYRGLLVLGSDNASPYHGDNVLAGEPQSGIWLGKTDDLWNFGKPSGWGGPWWKTSVTAGCASDPYLMTGFDKKVLHLNHDNAETVTFDIEVDFLGIGEYHLYETISVGPRGYKSHTFPEGFSAHWVRVVPRADCIATAQFFYT